MSCHNIVAMYKDIVTISTLYVKNFEISAMFLFNLFSFFFFRKIEWATNSATNRLQLRRGWTR